jgi:heat shock protein HslJ
MRHRIIILLSGLALSPLALAADTLSSLAGSEWGFPGAQAKMAPYIQFRSGGRVSGFGGCNRFNGSYAQAKDKLRLGPLSATRMACSPQIMNQERDLFALLSLTRTVAATHLVLILKDNSGAVLATLARRDWD